MRDETTPYVEIRPWLEGDLALLERLMGDPTITQYMGGPETLEQIRARHQRYVHSGEQGRGPMFVILAGPEQATAGIIGYWEHAGDEPRIWETGWCVLPEFQGRGIATRALQLMLQRARGEGRFRSLHAYAAVDNAPSNALCRKSGFQLQGQVDEDYPAGHPTRYNDWMLELDQAEVSEVRDE